MSRRIWTIAGFLGPAAGVEPPAVARRASLNPADQIAGEEKVRSDRARCHGSKAGWAKSLLPLWLLLLATGAWSPQLSGVEDPYTSEYEKSAPVDFHLQDKMKQAASVRQEQFRKRVSIRDAVGEDVPLAFAKPPAAVEKPSAVPPPNDSVEIARQGIYLMAATILVVILCARLLAPKFCQALVRKFTPRVEPAETAMNSAAAVRAEEEAFGAFLSSFQAGPVVSPIDITEPAAVPREPKDVARDFSAQIGQLLAAQRSLLQEFARVPDDAVRQRLLADLKREMLLFKGAVSSPDLLPAWQLTSALEGLLSQLSGKAGQVTRSTMRTVAGAVDLLSDLCQPGVRSDLPTNPPMRFLAVDDDVISRTAVSIALRRAFSPPELAENGVTALEMAARQGYDVIFLDVQMQGMDGFELCSKIHETSANKDTPVIFVTGMSDFDARANSVLNGGSDLMGKPFLTFEITVKALTFALARRLHSPTAEPVVEIGDANSQALLLSDQSAVDDPAVPSISSLPDAVESPQSPAINMDQSSAVMSVGIAEVASGTCEEGDNIEGGFLEQTAQHFAALRAAVQQIADATGENTRQEAVADLYFGLHALTPLIDPEARRPAVRVSTALEGLLKKQLQNPQNWTSSTLPTITNAVGLLQDLCAPGVAPDLAANPSIRILVVDDDLVSRRAMICALQMAFDKPQDVGNGEAALVRATEKTFDVIFLDVQMPGMDGFAACAKIRQTTANRATPVVFVTGQTDGNTRMQSAACGANDFIAKPFLTSEITVKALTFALRARLQQSNPANVPPLSSGLTEARSMLVQPNEV